MRIAGKWKYTTHGCKTYFKKNSIGEWDVLRRIDIISNSVIL